MSGRRSILALIALVCLLALGCHEPPPLVERPNFLVLFPDSLRADRVLAKRDGEWLAPNMASLAQRGGHFEHAVSQAGWTMPALAATLTGRYPVLPEADHSMLGWMEPGARSFPAILSLYDYQSFGFLGSNSQVLANEFTGEFQAVIGEKAVDKEGTSTVPGVAPDLSSWLAAGPPEPFLAFVHDVDLQFAQLPAELAQHEALLAQLRSQRATSSEGDELAMGELARALRASGESDLVRLVSAAYDQTVAAYDRSLGPVLEALQRGGLAQRTVIVLASPHGHQLGEHGRFEHGSLHEPDLRIPLLWVDPSAPDPGRRVARSVQLLDLAPTILARAGVAVDSQMMGQSLLPLLGLADGKCQESRIFSLNNRRDMALRWRQHKLLRFEPGGRRRGGRQSEPGYLLFDLSQDPQERRNLLRKDPPSEASELQTWLEEFHRERLAKSGISGEEGGKANPALRRKLKEQGYWRHVERKPGEEAPDAPPTP